MEYLPKITETIRLQTAVPVHSYLLDHCFEGNAVLPAVETVQLLATIVKKFRPNTDITGMTDARFDKFLFIQRNMTQINAFTDIAVHENGDITATLFTKNRSKKSSITRIKEHATVRFPRIKPGFSDQPLDLMAALEGICVEISSDKIYRDLVPFGPAYHNIRDILHIAEAGAIAKTGTPANYTGSGFPCNLGSPFILDAAFHAACVWGQRYSQTVVFPVAIDKRVIFKRTRPGETYISCIQPVQTEQPLLIFDIWIYNRDGCLFEAISGIRMRDISAGRLKPPQWIIDRSKEGSLNRIRRHCHNLSVIELKTVLPFAEKTLSGIEKKRGEKMKDRRKRSYLAARLACKRLSRSLSGNDTRTSAVHITTICLDQVRPCCPLTACREVSQSSQLVPAQGRANGSSIFSCAVSHDDRFAIAVAARHPIGIDVEKISERALKSSRLYMSAEEQSLVKESRMGEIESAVRIWSIKEAVAKSLNITMADSWARVQVIDTGRYESRTQIDNRDTYPVFHDTVDKHLFTIIEIP